MSGWGLLYSVYSQDHSQCYAQSDHPFWLAVQEIREIVSQCESQAREKLGARANVVGAVLMRADAGPENDLTS